MTKRCRDEKSEGLCRPWLSKHRSRCSRCPALEVTFHLPCSKDVQLYCLKYLEVLLEVLLDVPCWLNLRCQSGCISINCALCTLHAHARWQPASTADRQPLPLKRVLQQASLCSGSIMKLLLPMHQPDRLLSHQSTCAQMQQP